MTINPLTVRRLESLIAAFSAGNSQDVKSLGRNFIEQAVSQDDKALAKISVVAYSLYKMLSKEHFVKSPRWPTISRSITSSLTRSTQALQRNDVGGFSKSLEDAVHRIEGADDQLSNFARNIFEKAKIKQASTAYAMGLSLNQSASLTGSDRKELQKYIGATKIHDEQPVKMNIGQRMKMLRELLAK
ncbi:MAG: hypothetical protein HY544_04945 [Candidatus Diapherotrites archaeon]|uniref:Uncharacterized protein n=1 Tax=Candidatus Iainarchaeum sp. TaxID=3101447 RepID=A0A8T3YJW3_9ARCH|nr:hypothetical protein [Candidatus Diapherotrites archaeon]